MTPPAKRKASGKRVASKADIAAAKKGVALADLITNAPRLSDPDAARSRVSEWLASVPSVEALPRLMVTA